MHTSAISRSATVGWRWRKDAIDQAIQLLRNGLALVRDSARLHAALGVAYLQYREAGIDFGEGPLLEAEACARRVFELEPASAGGLQLRGWIHYSRARIQEAVRDLKLALDAGAKRSGHTAPVEQLLSDLRPSVRRASVARPSDLDRPVDAVDALHAGVRLAPRRRPRGAIGPYREMFEMDPGNPMARLFYVWVLLLNRRIDAAAPILESFPRRGSRHGAGANRGFSSRRRSPRMAATVGFHRSRRIWKRRRVRPMYSRGCWPKPTRLPESQRSSIRWIEVAIERGFINYPFLARWDPCLEGLRSDSRFVALMEVVRERWMRFES